MFKFKLCGGDPGSRTIWSFLLNLHSLTISVSYPKIILDEHDSDCKGRRLQQSRDLIGIIILDEHDPHGKGRRLQPSWDLTGILGIKYHLSYIITTMVWWWEQFEQNRNTSMWFCFRLEPTVEPISYNIHFLKNIKLLIQSPRHYTLTLHTTFTE